MTNKKVEELVEWVAEREHEQWIYWSKSLMTELNDILHKLPEGSNEADGLYKRLLRWQRLQIPYSELTEKQKEQDRIWAYKVIHPDLALIDRGIELEIYPEELARGLILPTPNQMQEYIRFADWLKHERGWLPVIPLAEALKEIKDEALNK